MTTTTTTTLRRLRRREDNWLRAFHRDAVDDAGC